jgi:type VI secretion system protein VasL
VYKALCLELGKLAHPACPDVDWRCVERCCVNLFACHGADLQSAAAYVLACSHLSGLDGLEDSLTVVETLVCGGAVPWPRGVAARKEIFIGLFGHLQATVRRMNISAGDVEQLNRLSSRFDSLHDRLEQALGPVCTLEGLRQQLARRVTRLERDAQDASRLALARKEADAANGASPSPCRFSPSPDGQPGVTPAGPGSRRRLGVWLGVLIVALCSLIAAFANY